MSAIFKLGNDKIFCKVFVGFFLVFVLSVTQEIKGVLRTEAVSDQIKNSLESKLEEFRRNATDGSMVAAQKYSPETAKMALKIAEDNIETYQRAVEDAMEPSSEKIAKLISIVPWSADVIWDESGEYVLMTYWTSKGTVDGLFSPTLLKNLEKDSPVQFKLLNAKLNPLAKKAVETGEWDGDLETFLTPAPQVRDFIRSWIKKENRFVDAKKLEEDRVMLNLRILQYLGMPPSWSYLFTNRYFVMMWVKPEDLFRPCPDTEITDDYCHIDYSDEQSKKGLSLEQRSIIEKRQSRNKYTLASKISYENNFFRIKIGNTYSKDPYPWTRLGYTYDWRPDAKTIVGASEFIIRPDAMVKVISIQPTVDFFLRPVRVKNGDPMTRVYKVITVTEPKDFILRKSSTPPEKEAVDK